MLEFVQSVLMMPKIQPARSQGRKTPSGRKTYNVLSIQKGETAMNLGTEYSGKAASPKKQKRNKTKEQKEGTDI